MASNFGMPPSRSWLAWSICKIEFFLTTANSTRMPNSEKILIDWWKINSESSANGSVSGSESRIVIGWSHDSNWAAMQR